MLNWILFTEKAKWYSAHPEGSDNLYWALSRGRVITMSENLYHCVVF